MSLVPRSRGNKTLGSKNVPSVTYVVYIAYCIQIQDDVIKGIVITCYTVAMAINGCTPLLYTVYITPVLYPEHDGWLVQCLNIEHTRSYDLSTVTSNGLHPEFQN